MSCCRQFKLPDIERLEAVVEHLNELKRGINLPCRQVRAPPAPVAPVAAASQLDARRLGLAPISSEPLPVASTDEVLVTEVCNNVRAPLAHCIFELNKGPRL